MSSVVRQGGPQADRSAGGRAAPSAGEPATEPLHTRSGCTLRYLVLLGLGGVAMRIPILAIPPVIPQIHRDLALTETQVGLLVGLPLAMFALAAVPGSLLIARIGLRAAVLIGMVVAAAAGAARGAAFDIWSLYAAVIATGIGVAVVQPAMPTLVRTWLPEKIGLGSVAFTSGMLIGATLPPILTGPLVLPLVGGSWRLNLVAWAALAILIPPLFLFMSPKASKAEARPLAPGQPWWPDWRDPKIWLLGLTLGTNNSAYFSTNAFVGDYLISIGHAESINAALDWLNGSQLVSLVVLFALAGRLHRAAWPFLIFGPILFASLLGMIYLPSATGIVVNAALIGFTTAFTLTAALALPAVLAKAADVPRTAAGMFTISYACAIVIPTVCGALWDLTGKAWSVWIPLAACAAALTVLGTIVTRQPSAAESGGNSRE
jgi:CP family cyanate transporter-like MFS transporter